MIDNEDEDDLMEEEEVISGQENFSQEQLREVVEMSQEIISYFVANVFGEETETKVKDIFNKVSVLIDSDPKMAEKCSGYFDGENVFLTNEYCLNNDRKIELLKTCIHEYAHSFSALISNLDFYNPVIEEALANLFVEMSINFYLQNKKEISYISKEKNEKLQNSGYYNLFSYQEEGEFTKSILYVLRCEGEDLLALKEYFFGQKENFRDICSKVLGEDAFNDIISSIDNVKIYVGKNNSDEYLPQATQKLRDVLGVHFSNPLGEECISDYFNRKEGNLYSVTTPILEQVYYEKQMQYEWLDKELDFNNLTKEDIQQLYRKSNGIISGECVKYGYSNFIRNFISSWYNECNGNLEKFDEILTLTGGIPFEHFLVIIEDNHITDLNEILKIFSKYHIASNDEEYKDGIEYLMQYNLQGSNQNDFRMYQNNNRKKIKVYITDETMYSLSTMNLNSSQLQEILSFYYGDEPDLLNINNIFEILEQQDFDKMPDNSKERYR